MLSQLFIKRSWLSWMLLVLITLILVMSFNNKNDKDSSDNDDTTSENFHTIDNHHDDDFTATFSPINKIPVVNNKILDINNNIENEIVANKDNNKIFGAGDDDDTENFSYKNDIRNFEEFIGNEVNINKEYIIKKNYQDEIINNEWNNNLNNNGNEEKQLSRKRRYLTFPEGSSFQLVWDGIVPIVDYNNYLILGITVALAWALPSDPPSEQLEIIREKLNNGTLGLQRNDNIKDIKYIDSKNENLNENSDNYYHNSKVASNLTTEPLYKDWSRYQYDNSQFHPPLKYENNWKNGFDSKYHRPMYYSYRNSSYPNRHYQKLDSPWTRFANRITNALRRNGQPNNNINSNSHLRNPIGSIANGIPNGYTKSKGQPTNAWRTSGYYDSGYKPNGKRKHRIYPVFGKRKKRDTTERNFDRIEKMDLNYHRRSRHELYGKIEKFLEAQGHNGVECVLKAICETGQKEDEEIPTDFLGEIMRAIFTIPQSIDHVDHNKHRMYDDAHAHEGDCNEKYPLCPSSIWDTHFVF